MPTNRKDQDSRKDQASKSQTKGKQGFASMPKEQVREIAAEGGRHSHGGNKGSKER
ncbi:MAG: KGG domain-containing protein [Candidatus Paracaedibacteraceae bacterium]|nr:KGG domain-containing protein [Candidatus Paracaedibacteraceae bacterium]